MPFCTACGKAVRPDDSFCGHCGAELNANREPAADVSPAQAGPASNEPVVTSENLTEHTPTPPPSPPAAVPTPPVQSAPQTRATPRNVQPPPAAPAPRSPARREGRDRGKGGLTFFGVVLALAWLAYSSGFLGALNGIYAMDPAQFVRQADWISFGLMIGLPILISTFRPVLDTLLIPLQPIRFRIPARMLVGMGLITPVAVSWWLYDVSGFRNYEFLHMSLVLSTLITYAILRTPKRYSA